MSQIDKKFTFGSITLDNTESSFYADTDVSWIAETSRRVIATKATKDNYMRLEAKLKYSFKSTAIFMIVYYNIEDYTYQKEGDRVKKISEIQMTNFKEILSSREKQKYLKKLLIEKMDYNDLVELDKNLPSFNLEADLKFLRCMNKLKLEQKPKEKIDLEEVADSLVSDYFDDLDKIFEKRYDLKLKVLGLYQ